MIQPTSNRVAVRHVEEETTRASGIVLVASASTGDASVRAEVIAAGPGVWVKGERVPMSVVVGDTVVVPRYAGVEVEVDGEKCVILNETDILAVVG